MIHPPQRPNLLSTQESLSDSSNDSTIRTKESKPRTKKTEVSFHRNMLVYEYSAHSQEDRNRMHHTREDMKSFANGFRRYLQNVRRIERKSSTTYTTPRADTGLEGLLQPERKNKHRLQGVLSVLLEQDRQYDELGYLTPTDLESMSRLYQIASQESKEEAYERALVCRSSSYGGGSNETENLNEKTCQE